MNVANTAFLLATPINTTHHVLCAHAHNLAQFVGKGRQQPGYTWSSSRLVSHASTLQRAGYVLYRALVVLSGEASAAKQPSSQEAIATDRFPEQKLSIIYLLKLMYILLAIVHPLLFMKARNKKKKKTIVLYGCKKRLIRTLDTTASSGSDCL